jgi:hypothetical protein
MKKAILIPILIIGLVYHAFAQQNGKTKHMIISIMEKSGKPVFGHAPSNVFITRDDTAQVQSYVEFNNLHLKVDDKDAAHEAQIMQLLEPYYNNGWKLVTASRAQTNNVDSDNISRFFFTKDD